MDHGGGGAGSGGAGAVAVAGSTAGATWAFAHDANTIGPTTITTVVTTVVTATASLGVASATGARRDPRGEPATRALIIVCITER